ncbi:TonB-dependent receptor [Cellvibrio sp. UBA7661]|uniref:TonB-dependent receptor n=1 Tax=Cellvibrio sp. UBA7661 TaxID=1946311 RepID=UPI002F360217
MRNNANKQTDEKKSGIGGEIGSKKPELNIGGRGFKKSLLALSIMAMGAPVLAQTANTADPDLEEVVVQGIRTSLEDAQALKREGDTVKDVITASDIGALPDKSITEALQRVPGVTVGRFAAPTDPNHFAAEGRGVLVRGLDRVHSQFNGRESFSAGNWTSGLSYEDIPPELVGTVEVIKNQTSDIIAGGVAGTVNLITRKPLDMDGCKIFISAKTSYGDLVDDWSPSYSGLFSDRWDTSVGEFGLLISASTSEFTARGDGINLSNFYERSATQTEYPTLGNTELPGYAGQKLFMPTGPWMQTADSNRDRNGFDVALQWQNPDETLRATAEFIRSDSEESWRERVLFPTTSSQGFDADLMNAVLVGNDATFDENGYFTSGTISYPWNVAYLASSRGDRTESIVEDASFNLVITPDDKWKIELDLQTLDTSYDRENNTINNRFAMSDVFLDLRTKVPTVKFLGTNASGGAPDWMGCPAGANPGTTDLSDPAGACDYYQVSIMDTNVDATGSMDSFTADVEYQIDGGWLKSVAGGAYFADIDRTTQDDEYINWGAVSHTWGTVPTAGMAGNPELYEAVNFGSDFMGGRGLAGDNRTFLFPRMSNTQEKNLLAYDAFLMENGLNNGGWHNRATRVTIDGKPTDAKGYLPHETVTTGIDREEAYIRFDFVNDELAMPIKANLGLRYVSYGVEASGTSRFNKPGLGDVAQAYYEQNFPTYAQFFNGDGSTVNTAKPDTYTTTLPSFNLSVGVTDDVIARLALSKAVFFPSLYDMRNTVNYNAAVTSTEDPANPGTIVDMQVSANGVGGNPYLQPEESDQIDLTAEWYFSEVGSLTLSVFHKNITNLFRERNYLTTVTNPVSDVSLDMLVRKQVNEGEGKIQGFEIAYQQFYDFLPGFWSGLGTQFNYTYVSQDDLEDTKNGTSVSVGGDRNAFRNFNNLPLPGLSEDTYNFALMYQYEGIEARFAYNWRSEYLITRRDANAFAPIFSEDQGYLDASIWYTINDNFRIGIEGSNLLDEMTLTRTQFNQDGVTTPKNFSLTDRRYALSVRATF